MKTKLTYAIVCLAAFFLVAGAFAAEGSAKTKKRYVEPSSPQVREHLEWFQDQKLCLMMHFGIYANLGVTESWPLVSVEEVWSRDEVEWIENDTELKRQYFALNRCFNPVRFNAKDIARIAKRCGFRYVAFTTKHHDGFCLWDTKYTDYKTTSPDCPYSSSPNADIVRRLFDACRAEGLGISAYFSKADWSHDDFWENRGIGVKTTRYPTYDTKANPEKWARFKVFTKNQLLELVRDYGPIDALWLDGGWVNAKGGCDLDMKDIIESARLIQPNLIAVDRGQKDEYMNVSTPEQTVPAEPLGYPWESCITMGTGWGYHYDDSYKSPRELIHLLIDVVSKGGNLALNVGPSPDGRLPHPAVERMEDMGRWLSKNGKAIYATRSMTPYALGGWRFTRGKDGSVFAIRPWSERERQLAHVLLPVAPEQGEVRRVVHLASGSEMAFEDAVGDYENGVRTKGVKLTFSMDFPRDEFADVFKVEYRN